MKKEDVHKLVSELSLEEKAGLLSGKDNWFSKAAERLFVPAFRMSDGPHGLRTQSGEVNDFGQKPSIPATCYPTASASACSFERELLFKMGESLGRECQQNGVNILLGPGVNMKRTPLCGRNFEYFSEDPVVAGELGAAYVKGLQSQGVGASLKHFFANNQEFRRLDSSSEMDERTAYEYYLPAFERIVKNAKPWTVMAAYNKIDKTFCTENTKLLQNILRDEWGYDGAVVSDWGATHDRVAVTKAGTDLTMPCDGTDFDIVEAVKKGMLSESDVDLCCERVIELAFKCAENQRQIEDFDYEAANKIAREIAENAIVLLKNDRNILPLGKSQKVVFIGTSAKESYYQGGGSSRVNSYKVSNALDFAENVSFYDGANIEIAVNLARASDVSVIFVRTPTETEGVDRIDMQIPAEQNALVSAIAKIQPNTIVVLQNGSPVEIPWVNEVPAIVESYLCGQASGEAIVNVLYGKVNPSGHLAETFPLRLEDNPSYLNYPGENGVVTYNERMFVGYRYYASKNMPVLFPFGHGLSYTNFEFSDLTATDTAASVKVKNIGSRIGKALIQLYIAPPKGEVSRPIRELIYFEKVQLEPGETKEVDFELTERDFAVWSVDYHDWRVPAGVYSIQVCENAQSVLLQQEVEVVSSDRIFKPIFTNTTHIKDFAETELGAAFINKYLGVMFGAMAELGYFPKDWLNMFGDNISLEGLKAANRLDDLLEQSISLMLGFVSEEGKKEFSELLKILNKEA